MKSSPRRGITTLGVVAGLLLAAAAALGIRAHLKVEEHKEWFAHRPCQLRVDLSRPGATRSKFMQTTAVSHGEVVHVTVGPTQDSAGPKDLSALFAGLKGEAIIRDPGGKDVLRLPLDGDSVQPGWLAGEYWLAHFAPLDEGVYTISFEIERGAPALAGLEQTASARYLFCGCESLPAVLTVGGALATGLPGLALGLVLLVRASRRKPGAGAMVEPLD